MGTSRPDIEVIREQSNRITEVNACSEESKSVNVVHNNRQNLRGSVNQNSDSIDQESGGVVGAHGQYKSEQTNSSARIKKNVADAPD